MFVIEESKRATPKGLAWIKTRARGVDLLVLGPSESGKTCFSDYLIHGLLRPEAEHITTIEVKRSSNFAIPIGRNNSLTLRVRRSIDTPGQIGPIAHANLIKEKRPHAILVVLDSSSRVADLRNWISEFCVHVDRVLRETPAAKKKIRSFIVCLNKRDKVNNAQHYKARSQGVRRELQDGLGSTLGEHYVNSIPIMECVSVENSVYGPKLLDAIIAEIAKQVR